MNSELELAKLFKEIKSRGWIETKRHGDQCLGNTFEDLIGKIEDNKPEADFYDIELKVHRNATNSLVSLFSKAPSYPRRVNTYLRETYGSIDEAYGKKVLNTTVSGAKENTHKGGHSFKIIVDREKERLYLQVRDLATNQILPDEIFWSFSVLEKALEKKIKKLAIFTGDEKIENGKHYVKYDTMRVLSGLTLEQLLKSIEDGNLLIDIRIGVYASGKNEGKTHDHGTGFRIRFDKLISTYGNVSEYR